MSIYTEIAHMDTNGNESKWYSIIRNLHVTVLAETVMTLWRFFLAGLVRLSFGTQLIKL